MVFGVEFLATTLESSPLLSSTSLLRTHAFADHLHAYWERHGQTDFPSLKLQEPLDQFLAEAARPTLPTERLRGRLNGCHVWSAHPNLVILFDRVEHDRQNAVLVLALGRPVRWS